MTDDWELEQRVFYAAAEGGETTATKTQVQEVTRELWTVYCTAADRIEALEAALGHALAMIESPYGYAIREDESWLMYRDGIRAALQGEQQ